MVRTLQMIFATSTGSTATISLADPLEELTSTEVEQVMQQIVDSNMFSSTRGDLVGIVAARIVSRQITDIIAA